MQRLPLTVSQWPMDDTVPLDEITLGGLLRRVAAEEPDAVALVDGQADPAARRRWTYAELESIAETVARALLTRFEPGERIAVWEINRPEWVMLQLGAALAGLVLVTVNPQYRPAELAYAVGQSRSVGLVHGREHRGVSMPDVVAGVRGELPLLREAICFDDWDALLASADPSITLPEPDPWDPCVIIYTSGTTGFAKGAVLHHVGCINASAFAAERANFQLGDCWINPIPLFHTGGGILASLGCLARKGRHVVVPQFDPGLVLELIEAEGGNLILTVPTILRATLDHPSRPTRDLTSLRTVMSGGSNVPADLVRRTKATLACDFSMLFGQAEQHGTAVQTYPTDSDDDQAETLGQALPQAEVKIADLATGAAVAIGAEGEICSRGYQNMIGYFDMDGPGQQVIDADGWLHTGDMGTMDDRGYLRIAGRIKDLIIRGGENIHPSEVEEVLGTFAGVEQVAVVGVPDEHWGEQVAAVIRPVAGATRPDPAEMHAYCRERMAPFKAPKIWFFADDFPMTPSGKIQKFALRKQIADGELTAT